MSREAKLTLRLVDAVTGPGRAAAATLRNLQSALSGIASGAALPARALADQARGIQRATAALAPVSAGIGIGAVSVFRQTIEIERELNRSLAAADLSLEQRSKIMDEAIRLNKIYGGSLNDVVGSATELLRSGIAFEDLFQIWPNVLNLGQATGENLTDVTRAVVTNLTAIRSEMSESARATDLFAQALDRTAGVNLGDFETSGKYFNPVGALVGLDAEEIMAFQIEMARRGIFGSSAGTGLRAGPANVLAPTPKGREAIAALGLNRSDYIGERTGEAGAEQVAAALEARGLTIDDEMTAALAQILRGERDHAARSRAILDGFGEQLGVLTAEDRTALNSAIMDVFAQGARRVDFGRFLEDAQARGAGISFWNALVGRNHGSKFAGFDPGAYFEELGLLRTEAVGAADRKAAQMMLGLPGQANEAEGGLQGAIRAVVDAGLLEGATNGLSKFAAGMERLAKTSPGLLKFSAYSALALAAAAPLGFALSGLAAAAGLVVSPLAIAAGGLAALAIVNLRPIANGIRTFSNALRAAVAPSVVAAVGRGREAFGEFFGGLRLHHLALNRLGTRLGRGLGIAISQLAASAPQLRQIGAAFGPLASAARNFAVDKLLALQDASRIVADFAAKAGPAMSPALASAIALVGGSLDVLGRGAGAAGRLIGGATEGVLSFARGIIEGIDPAALASAGRGITAVLDGLALPLDRLRSLFDSIDLDVAGLAGRLGGALGTGISWVVEDLARGHTALTNAWDHLRGTLVSIGSYVPDFSTITAGIASFVGFMSESASRLKGAADTISGMFGGGGRANLSGDVFGDGSVPVGGGPGVAPPSNFVGSVPVGGRATGGLVRSGYEYRVNERGEEVIRIGNRAGYITPAHRLEGAQGSDVRAASWRPAAPAMQKPVDLGHLARGGASSRERPPVTINISGPFNGVAKADAESFGRQLAQALSRSSQIGLDY